MIVRAMNPADWPQVSQIYEEGIVTGIATFETEVPSYEQWDGSHLEVGRLVAVHQAKIAGWCALSPVSSRCVYEGVAEVSVYIARSSRGIGIGKLLLKQLIQSSEEAGFWTLQSGIFPENMASIVLHEDMGFRYLGRREKIAKCRGIWQDNLIFERRSTAVGID
ncbi:GNAT family N-acetyltransferase [Spongiimicrobium salis]|uniref:GNAT family N-acetyltransferase n=1 Tax=Spongiimicrobium salis TaxID=1667022 RepID=UPI00374C99ED